MDREGWDGVMELALHLSRTCGQKVYVRGYRQGHTGKWVYGVYLTRLFAGLISRKWGSGVSAMADDRREHANG